MNYSIVLVFSYKVSLAIMDELKSVSGKGTRDQFWDALRTSADLSFQNMQVRSF